MNTILRATASVLLLGGACALPAQAEPPAPADDAGTPLEPITVKPNVAPLDQSLHALRQMAQRSTPCLGCDAVLAVAQPAPGMALLQYLFAHRSPNQVDEVTRRQANEKAHDAPDLDYLKR